MSLTRVSIASKMGTEIFFQTVVVEGKCQIQIRVMRSGREGEVGLTSFCERVGLMNVMLQGFII